MKKWAWAVVFLYFLLLVVLTWPVGSLAFYKNHDVKIAEMFSSKFYWLVLGVMVLAQAALLAVPVQVANRRPVARRSILLSLAVSGLMMAALILGAILSLREFIVKGFWWDQLQWVLLPICGAIWLAWTMVFYRLSRKGDPQGVISRECRSLLKGSILELLIAVPTHVVARHRDYCCAGFDTFFGLTMGLSVMLFSFGPGVFFLFAERWNKLHPPEKAIGDTMGAGYKK